LAKREIRVSGGKEFEKFYRSLNLKSELKRYIDEAMDSLKEKHTIGDKIEKQLWPKEYIKKYGINNLNRYSIGSNWRMIYTIISDGKDITCAILEVLPHKEYDKRFGYHTS
jgi:hypothetical protein